MSQPPHRAPDRPTVYPSAVDLWLIILLMMAPAIAGAVGIYMWRQGNTDGANILFLTSVATLCSTLVFVLPCRYTIDNDELHIRCGIISYRVPLKIIESVEPSRTLVSGPALSLKRVIVKTKLKSYILSPRERDRFIDDVTHASAALRANDSD